MTLSHNPMTVTSTIPTPASHEGDRLSLRQRLAKQIASLSNALAQVLAQGDEPKVTLKAHHDGTQHWIIYDPISRQRIICSSEKEVRLWLDQRYSRSI